MFVELTTDCVATSVYADGVLLANNAKAKMPEITPMIVELTAAGGKVSMPIFQHREAMEASITLNGVTKQTLAAIKPEAMDITVNVAQCVVGTDGSQKTEQVKHVIRGISKSVAGVEIAPGEQSEREFSFSVLSYKVFVSGEEYINVDQLNGICRINGKDYGEEVRSLL